MKEREISKKANKQFAKWLKVLAEENNLNHDDISNREKLCMIAEEEFNKIVGCDCPKGKAISVVWDDLKGMLIKMIDKTPVKEEILQEAIEQYKKDCKRDNKTFINPSAEESHILNNIIFLCDANCVLLGQFSYTINR